MVSILKGAEAFRFEADSQPAVLVLHGFTGSTQSMHYLGEELHRRFGFHVCGPRLAGHGTSPNDMATTGYLDWLGTAVSALKEMAASQEQQPGVASRRGARLASMDRLQAASAAVCTAAAVFLTRACNNSDGAGFKQMQSRPF